jgi:hypothetical protein
LTYGNNTTGCLKNQIKFIFKEALKKVASDGQARRSQAKKRSLRVINEHFEPDFNTAGLSVVVFQNFLNLFEQRIS